MLYGIASGFFWMTREEGLGHAGSIGLGAIVCTQIVRSEGRQGISELSPRVLIVLGSALLLVLSVCSLNYANMGHSLSWISNTISQSRYRC